MDFEIIDILLISLGSTVTCYFLVLCIRSKLNIENIFFQIRIRNNEIVPEIQEV